MKRYAPYIFIVVVLIGLLKPVAQVHADPMGTCAIAGGSSSVSPALTTQADCTIGTWTLVTNGTCEWVPGDPNTGNPQEADNVPCTPPTTGPISNNLNSYTLLAPLPCPDGVTASNCTNGQLTSLDTTGNGSLGVYLNIIIRIVIGIAAVMAMIMIVIGGIQYMTSDFVSSKEEGKHRIKDAIFGLILAVAAYLILNTINPDLLKTDFSSLANQTVNVNVGGESPSPFTPINQSALQAFGITSCTGSGGASAVVPIGQQFQGKTTYSQAAGQRNTINSLTITIDCSAFVDQVYTCAGLPNPGGNTAAMFSSGSSTQVNGATYDYTKLSPGDLVGWPPSDDKNGNGHVAIYVGNGQILDTTPQGTSTRPLSSIQSRITHIKTLGSGTFTLSNN